MTIGPYLSAVVRENAALRGFRSRERVAYPGVEVDVVLQAGPDEIGVEIRPSSSFAGLRTVAEAFKDIGLVRAIFVFADPAVAQCAEDEARSWPEELAAFAAFTTAHRIGELL